MHILSELGHSTSFSRRQWSVLAASLLLLLTFGVACRKQDANSSNSPPGKKTQASGKVKNQKFIESLSQGFPLPDDGDEVALRVLADYGAVFVARGGATPPPVILFADEAAVADWQASVKTTRASLGGIDIELQAPAMAALMEAREEAQAERLEIAPRGRDAARRSYAETVSLWQSRVNPGLKHWVEAGSLTESEAARLRQLSPHDQIPEILRLEAGGLYFSKDFSKSILYSVAAPGTSQHISMLALDVQQHENPKVRSILARHGWFQTVSSDLPHFTFLGVAEDQLPSLGLKKVSNSGRTFWIPKLD